MARDAAATPTHRGGWGRRGPRCKTTAARQTIASNASQARVHMPTGDGMGESRGWGRRAGERVACSWPPWSLGGIDIARDVPLDSA
eukprot:6938223-Pyramimonas_sp.AAC.1